MEKPTDLMSWPWVEKSLNRTSGLQTLFLLQAQDCPQNSYTVGIIPSSVQVSPWNTHNNPQEFPLARSSCLFCHWGVVVVTHLDAWKYFVGFQRINGKSALKCVVNIQAFNNFYLFERKGRLWKWTKVLEALQYWRKNKIKANSAGGNCCCF